MKTLITALLIITLTACNSTGDDMTITIIDENITLEDSNITEDIPSFSPLQRIYIEDDQVTSGNFVYQRVGKDINVLQFDDTKEDYNINDLVFTDKLEYVFQNKGEQLVAKQPETYTNDTSPLPSNWINRYVKLGSFNDNSITLNVTVDSADYTYNFVKNGVIVDTTITKGVQELEEYRYELGTGAETGEDTVYAIVGLVDSDAFLLTTKNGSVVQNEKLTSDFQVDIEYDFSDGRVKAITDQITLAKEDYTDEQWLQRTGDYSASTIATLYSYSIYIIKEVSHSTEYKSVSSINENEEKAITVSEYPIYENGFTPKCYIVRGLDLYLRTDKDIEQETEIIDIASIQLLPITSPVTIPWGWSILRPTMKYALLDSEKNTKMTSNANKYFILKSSKPFDTIVLNSIIASKVKVTINGVTTQRTPVNVLTMGDKSITAPTKIAMYYDEMYPAGTSVMIEVETLNGLLELGGVYLGEKYNIGMTDIPFEKRFERIQTLTPNEFGQVEFVDRAVVEKYSSTVTFESRYFSFLDAFFRENLAGGRKAFFDGGDNTKNVDGDTNKIKNAMALMGRAVDNPLQHFEENGHEAEYGKMQIEVREDV